VSVKTVPGYDAMQMNIGSLPAGQAAGYATGSPWIAWTAADWDAHPGAVRIDQDPNAADPAADILDVESGAATPGDAPGWYRRAVDDYKRASRPGQRWPAIYMSMGAVAGVADALIAGGVTSGPGLFIAEYGALTEAQARAVVANPTGPFPVIGFQWQDAGSYDRNVFGVPWLQAVSGTPPVPPVLHGYGKPRNLKAAGGHTTVGLSWDAPGTPGLPAPAEYLVYVYKGGVCRRSALVRSYPCTVIRDKAAVAQGERPAQPWEGHGLGQGESYIAHVVASGPQGANVRPYTYGTVAFKTG
jgi:hypothetical protein